MRVLSFRDGKWSRCETGSYDEVKDSIEADTLTWVRVGDVTPERMADLAGPFGMHPLTIEDILNERQRPKVEDYDGMTFTVVRLPRYGEGLSWHQVGVFLGDDFVLTASLRHTDELDALEERLLQKGLPQDAGADGLFHLVLDTVVDAWFPFMDTLEDTLEDIEDEVLDDADKAALGRIRDLKQVVSRTRKVLVPMRDAMQSLERGTHPNIRPATHLYLRDVADHTIRLAERLDHVKEMSLLAQETWNATLANEQNEQMRRLTVLFALFLFPTFVAGLGGMNFPGIPEWQYWRVTGTLLAFVGLGTGVAVWRRWL